MSGGTYSPTERVKLAMEVWNEAGETLFPEFKPPVAVSLDQLLKNLFPEVGKGMKKQSVKGLKTARMKKYREFLEWCEWARWGPHFVMSIPNERDGGQKEIPIINSFVQKNVEAEIKAQRKDGIFNAEKLEEEFCYYCVTERLQREVTFGERARKGATASHAKKLAAKSSATASIASRKTASSRKIVK